MTKKPKRVMTKASKAGCRSAGGLRTKPGEDFLAHLNRSWELHGREILARVWAERPELYFKALVKLTLALHRATGEPTDFDRRRNREEVLRRLEARIADARTNLASLVCRTFTCLRNSLMIADTRNRADISVQP